MKQALFRHADGVWPNTAALAFTVLGWPLGIALLGLSLWALYALGVLLVALTLTWSAYFIHEFAHQAIFRTPQANERWGTLMSWINGSCYASFADLRRKHMRHHVERADVITFDHQAFLRAHPLVRRAVALYRGPLLDGFDLGLGILFPYFRTESDRDQMMNSVAPVWDGNEVWLVIGGGALFAGFPKVYAAVFSYPSSTRLAKAKLR